MNDMSEIPDNELRSDLADTIVDIRLCNIALALGSDEYAPGKTIQGRLEMNLRIKETIESEMRRRGLDTAK